jgi:hypothetical protein
MSLHKCAIPKNEKYQLDVTYEYIVLLCDILWFIHKITANSATMFSSLLCAKKKIVSGNVLINIYYCESQMIKHSWQYIVSTR